MKSTADTATPPIPPVEVERRIDEYRRLGFQRQAPAQVVYQGAEILCPWSACGLTISGIHFQLECMGNDELRASLLASWWNGPGLVGQCPRCKRLVLFGLTGKRPVTNAAEAGAAVLPERWYEIAHLVPKSP